MRIFLVSTDNKVLTKTSLGFLMVPSLTSFIESYTSILSFTNFASAMGNWLKQVGGGYVL